MAYIMCTSSIDLYIIKHVFNVFEVSNIIQLGNYQERLSDRSHQLAQVVLTCIQ